jgi:ParB-like chromosome segregation protein Spo0J
MGKDYCLEDLQDALTPILEYVSGLGQDERIAVLNLIRLRLHDVSPFSREPVDCVLWVRAESVLANNYNPNVVAAPEMKLLEHSVSEDGYTQPIVTWAIGENGDGAREVVDGFHRHRVGRESAAVRSRVNGYLPVTTINQERSERSDRIASTIRHNRARGRHQVDSMSEIVVELSQKGWTSEKIATELGMDADEVLRMRQISGLADMFSDREFSEAWEVFS